MFNLCGCLELILTYVIVGNTWIGHGVSNPWTSFHGIYICALMSQGSTTFMKKTKTSFNKVCQTTFKSSPSLSRCLTPSSPPAPRAQTAQLVNPPPHPLSFPSSWGTSVTCQIPLPAEQPPLTLTYLEPPCGIMMGVTPADYAFWTFTSDHLFFSGKLPLPTYEYDSP